MLAIPAHAVLLDPPSIDARPAELRRDLHAACVEKKGVCPVRIRHLDDVGVPKCTNRLVKEDKAVFLSIKVDREQRPDLA